MSATKARVRRFLGYFRPENDCFEGEIDVTHIPLPMLKEIFHPEPDDPLMYYCYNVDESQAKALQNYIERTLDTRNYRYQLQAEAVD